LKQISEGTLYEGNFNQGQKHGWGVLTWTDKSRLEGEWTHGKINGVVSLYFLFLLNS
jgi:hypothetical protein